MPMATITGEKIPGQLQYHQGAFTSYVRRDLVCKGKMVSTTSVSHRRRIPWHWCSRDLSVSLQGIIVGIQQKTPTENFHISRGHFMEFKAKSQN